MQSRKFHIHFNRQIVEESNEHSQLIGNYVFNYIQLCCLFIAYWKNKLRRTSIKISMLTKFDFFFDTKETYNIKQGVIRSRNLEIVKM